jgi:hypothetical protein
MIDEANLPGPCDAFTQAFTGKRLPGMGFCGRLFDKFDLLFFFEIFYVCLYFKKILVIWIHQNNQNMLKY